jgi:hypothetical protein
VNDTPLDHDPLEAELRSLRPADLPTELFDRVGAAVARRPRRGLWLVPAAAAAAGIVLAIAWHLFVQEMPPARKPVVAATRASAEQGVGDGPALFTYRRAIAGPPDAMDDLLDRHAARTLPAGPRVTAFTELSTLH